MTLREKILNYANRMVDYLSGTEYGQSGRTPTLEGLHQLQVSSINFAITHGRQAALADDPGSYRMWVDFFEQKKRLAHSNGMLPFMDECFRIGFGSIKKSGGASTPPVP